MKQFKNYFLLVGLCLLAFGASRKVYGFSAVGSLFSTAGQAIGGVFGGVFGSWGSCTNCESTYDGPTPKLGSGLPQWQYHPQGSRWTKITLDAIDKEGLAKFNPKDAKVYCPGWDSLSPEERRSFWLNFASKLAEQESGFSSTQSYFESVGSAFGTRSNGLFSMSVGDKCGILHHESDTFNDEKNIQCAIRTMKILLLKNGNYIGTGDNRGLGAYWQPLKDNSTLFAKQTRANKRAMLNFTRSLPYCQIPRRPPA